MCIYKFRAKVEAKGLGKTKKTLNPPLKNVNGGFGVSFNG
jgi:hypothetical protein